MNFALVFGKAAPRIKDIVKSFNDSLSLYVYDSISDLIKTSEQRKLFFTRILLNEENIHAGDFKKLNTYIKESSNSTTIVLVCNGSKPKQDKEFLKYFNSPLYTPVLISKLSTTVLKEIVDRDVLELKASYYKGFDVKAAVQVSEMDDKDVKSKTSSKKAKPDTDKKPVKGKKSGGFFGSLIGGKGKKKGQDEEVESSKEEEEKEPSPAAKRVPRSSEDRVRKRVRKDDEGDIDLSLGSLGDRHIDTGHLDSYDDDDDLSLGALGDKHIDTGYLDDDDSDEVQEIVRTLERSQRKGKRQVDDDYKDDADVSPKRRGSADDYDDDVPRRSNRRGGYDDDEEDSYSRRNTRRDDYDDEEDEPPRRGNRRDDYDDVDEEEEDDRYSRRSTRKDDYDDVDEEEEDDRYSRRSTRKDDYDDVDEEDEDDRYSRRSTRKDDYDDVDEEDEDDRYSRRNTRRADYDDEDEAPSKGNRGRFDLDSDHDEEDYEDEEEDLYDDEDPDYEDGEEYDESSDDEYEDEEYEGDNEDGEEETDEEDTEIDRVYPYESLGKGIYIFTGIRGTGLSNEIGVLAATEVGEGKKVLVIDADYKANGVISRLHDTMSFYSQNSERGIDNKTVYTEDGIDILSNGFGVKLTSDSLLSALKSDLVDRYDYVFVDCPADCLDILSGLEDSVFFIYSRATQSALFETSLQLTNRKVVSLKLERSLMASAVVILGKNSRFNVDLDYVRDNCLFANGSWLDRIDKI